MARILVIDDDPDIVLFARINLELHGHVVQTARDGVEALALVIEDPPDLVVLDVIMPLADGWEVLAEIKGHSDERLRTIPIVMLTALDADVDQARGGIEGAVHYLTKPLSPEDLLAAVTNALAGHEPDLRRAAQKRGLVSIARMERHAAGGTAPSDPHVDVSRLERVHDVRSPVPVPEVDGAAREVDPLTSNQRDLLDVLLAEPSVSGAAKSLGMSRSNIYASLRRIGRKVGVSDVSELLRLLRSGELKPLLDA